MSGNWGLEVRVCSLQPKNIDLTVLSRDAKNLWRRKIKDLREPTAVISKLKKESFVSTKFYLLIAFPCIEKISYAENVISIVIDPEYTDRVFFAP